MANDPVTDAVEGAKKALANADKFTSVVTGGATNAFAPKAGPKHIADVPSYKAAHAERKASGAAEPVGGTTADEIKARQANIPDDMK